MNSKTKLSGSAVWWRAAAATAAAIVSISALTGAAPAPEAQDNQPQIDRVIDLSDQKAPVPANSHIALRAGATTTDSDAPITTVGEIPLPSGVDLNEGETVMVNYADGVVTHEALAAGCTQSAYAGTPFRTSAAQARSAHSYSLSSSCTETHGSQSVLSSQAFPWWHQRASGLVKVKPGTAINWNTTKACADNGRSNWRSETGRGANILAVSPSVTLGCKVY